MRGTSLGPILFQFHAAFGDKMAKIISITSILSENWCEWVCECESLNGLSEIINRLYLIHDDDLTFTSMDTKIGSPTFDT